MQPMQECKSGGDRGTSPENLLSNTLRQRETCESRGTTHE